MSSIRDNLKKARANIVFLVGLTLAFALVYTLENWERAEISAPLIREKIKLTMDHQNVGGPRNLTAQEMDWAKIAWVYFENNYNPETGLVNSVDTYPASTMWDTSSYLLGLISAYDLQIINKEIFDSRVKALMTTLSTFELHDSLLPNKSYNTKTTLMVTYDNEETERGIGWSAIDLGRLMVPLNILVWQFPEYTDYVGAVLQHWKLAHAVESSEMIGAEVDEAGNTKLVQEGRLGYEEYASKSFSLIGMDVSKALDYELYLEFVEILGVDVGVDMRDPEQFGALNYVVSEPYILDGLEFGWDRMSKELANRLYAVQKNRFDETGFLTAVSEDNIDQAPYFVYNTVFADGKKWNATTDTGEDASQFRTLSTKAVFGWHALFDTEYTQIMMDYIEDNFDRERGWYSGIYEETGLPNKAITANTNGIILESLYYIKNGPLLSLYSNAKTTIAAVE